MNTYSGGALTRAFSSLVKTKARNDIIKEIDVLSSRLPMKEKKYYYDYSDDIDIYNETDYNMVNYIVVQQRQSGQCGIYSFISIMCTMTQNMEWIEATNKDIYSRLSKYNSVNKNIQELGFKFSQISSKNLKEGSYLLHVNYPDDLDTLDHWVGLIITDSNAVILDPWGCQVYLFNSMEKLNIITSGSEGIYRLEKIDDV